MNNFQFHQLAEQLTQNVEQYIENYCNAHDVDIDYERNGNTLEATFENRSKIIVNRQEPLQQIWLATKENGYHFDYIDEKWICNRTGRSFKEVIEQAIQKQI